jgi:hypothetical protein
MGVKIREKEKKREMISSMAYTKVFGAHNYEIGSKYAT